MKKLMMIAIITLAFASQSQATSYYWKIGNSYYPVGTVDDGDPSGFVSSTSWSRIWSMYSAARQKFQN